MSELTNVMENGEVKELSEKSTQLEKYLVGVQVSTVAQYEEISQKLKEVKGYYKRLDEKEKSFTAPLNQVKSAIIDFFRKPKDTMVKVEAVFKKALDVYDAEQARIAREAQARLDEQARLEREKLEKQAAAAAAKGKTEKADILLTKAALVSAPVVEVQKVVVAGQSTRIDWDFEIVNASEIPREYLMADEVKIRKMVRAFKEDAKIPGIRTFSKTIRSSTSN